jgi:flagellar biosynthesis GTPase FlhF
MSTERAETPKTITYRGRSLEEVLPKIREELGPDAVIERQRTGLVGGVGGFFQREMIEVDARPARPGEHGTLDVVAGDDEDVRAAAAPDPDRDEGLNAPAMRQIARQSEPFAELLADAEADAEAAAPEQASASRPSGPGDHDWDAWAEDDAGDDEETAEAEREQAPPRPSTPPPARPAGRPAGRHATGAYEQAGRPDAVEPPPPLEAERPPAAAPGAPAPETPAAAPGGRPRPAAADGHERTLVERGLSPQLAASVVGEAVSHLAPFAAGARGGLKKQVRTTLARRIPVLTGFGGSGRTIALVGAAGAGKTRAVAGLAAAYAAGSDLPVVVLSLRPPDVGAELRELLDPHGVQVKPVEDGAAARAHIGARAGSAMVLLDTPAVSPRDAKAIASLAADLQAAGVTETHLVVPATVAAPVARDALEAFAPLDVRALLITHADETDHLGPLVDLAVTTGRPLSYVAGEDVLPADPAALAARLLP